MITKNKLIKKLTEFTVPKKSILIVMLLVIPIDWALYRHFYENILDMAELGTYLALAMSCLIAYLPKLLGRLIARRYYKVSVVIFILSAFLISLIYFGMQEVESVGLGDTFNLFTEENEETGSNFHIYATALSSVLFLIATSLSYVFYTDYYKENPKNVPDLYKTFLKSSLSKAVDFLESIVSNLNRKAERIAKRKWNDELNTLNKRIEFFENEIVYANKIFEFELKRHEKIKTQIKQAVDKAYTYKPFLYFF